MNKKAYQNIKKSQKKSRIRRERRKRKTIREEEGRACLEAAAQIDYNL